MRCSALDRLPKVEGTGGEVHVSNDLGKLLNVTDKLAQKRGDQYISSELFILAALEDKGPLGKILRDCGVVKGAIERAIASGGPAVIHVDVDPVKHMWAPGLMHFKDMHQEPSGK